MMTAQNRPLVEQRLPATPSRAPPASTARAAVPALPGAVLQAIADRVADWAPHPPSAASASSAPETLALFDLDGFRYALTRQRLADAVRLSPRELEIVRLVATGMPNKCIGAVLEISAWTVATHLRRIFAKIGVNSRAAMIARLGGRHAAGSGRTDLALF